jgi:hypothetical protein
MRSGDKMALEMLDASVVVLSEGNNPKLLNHDFLARNKIVPEDWHVRDVVITPPFSNIVYENDVQFVVELNKLQIRAGKPEHIDCDRDLPKMVMDYLRVLPHVSYLGAGINYVFVLKDSSHDDIRKHFLQDGPWLEKEGNVSKAAIEFNYLNVEPQFNLKIESHASGIVFSVNYHQDFKPEQEDQRMQYIKEMGKLKTRFLEFARHLPIALEQES